LLKAGIFLISAIDRSVATAKSGRIIKVGNSGMEGAEVPRMKVGERQTFETLISEEALLFSKYLRKNGLESKNPKR